MMTDHWVISLLLGDTLSTLMAVFGTLIGWKIAVKWDPNSSSQFQLMLERKSYLVSALLVYVFTFEILSLWLFILTVNDHFPPLIRGAMCATGSLNVDSFGWPTLYLKVVVFFLLSFWIYLHKIDRQLPEYPLTKEKFLALLALSPVILFTTIIEFLYFVNIKPDIITTCCSVTFGAAGNEPTSVVAMNVKENLVIGLFYLFVGINVALNMSIVFFDRMRNSVMPFFSPVAGAGVVVIGFLAVIHHYAKYIYGMPAHHCPFDMLWKEYYFIGYIIDGLLFMTLISSFIVGIARLLKRRKLLEEVANRSLVRNALATACSTGALFVIVTLIKTIWKILY